MKTITGSVGVGGANRRHDVEVVQALINRSIGTITPLRPLKVDGQVGPQTIGAIETYQRRVLQVAEPDGRVDPDGTTIRTLSRAQVAGAAPVDFGARQLAQPTAKWVGVAAQETGWMPVATAEAGQKELATYEANNPRILEYMDTFPALRTRLNKKTGFNYGDVDETPWCACFVNWCLIRAGRPRGPSPLAADWVQYGKGLDVPVPGAITVIYKTPKPKAKNEMTPTGYHVGFYVSDAGGVTLLGGNQENSVKQKSFPQHRVIAYRWPL